MRTPLLLMLVVCLFAVPCHGWSTKEHIQLTRMAAAGLVADPATPPQMAQWLREASSGLPDREDEKTWFMEQRQGIVPRGVDGIPYWAVMPDTINLIEGRRGPKVEPFGVPEFSLHFLDVELFVTGDRPRAYRHDLSGKPALADIPRDMKDPRFVQAGMLPFRVEECYMQLVRQLHAGRMTDRPGQYPRDEHAAKWAGFLAHYLLDNTQPHHASVDYKSVSYFADKRNAPNVHAQLEYMMADDEHADHAALREEFWAILVRALDDVVDPIETDDLWEATVEVSLRSYDALPMIGMAAMAAAKQGGTPDKPVGVASEFDIAVFFRSRGTYLGREMSVMEMKAHQQAWGVKRVQRVWRRAWEEAQQGPTTLPPDPR